MLKKTWFRRLLVVLALAVPATAYAATKLSAGSCTHCPLGDCKDCPLCPHGGR